MTTHRNHNLTATTRKTLAEVARAQRQYAATLDQLYRQSSGADRVAVERVRRCVIGAQRVAEQAAGVGE